MRRTEGGRFANSSDSGEAAPEVVSEDALEFERQAGCHRGRPRRSFGSSASRACVRRRSQPDARGVVAGREHSQQLGASGGAPNVLLVPIDDTGFGRPSTFGGAVAHGISA